MESSGDKRKKQWKGGATHDQNKRHKGALGAAANAKGYSGVLVTCDKTKERQSVRDALNILNEAAEKYFPAPNADNAEAEQTEEAVNSGNKAGGGDSVQKLLEQEIAALKSDAKNRQTGSFTPLDTGVKGAVLIQFQNAALSPVALLDKIFSDVEATKEFPSRFINRMIPLEKIAYSSVEDIKEAVAPMIEQHLKEYRDEQVKLLGENSTIPPLEYAVEIKRRNCSHLKSMDVINALAALVGPEHKVNLTTPKTVLLVEVFRNTCGVSIVTNFHQYKKFNIRSILDPPVSCKSKENATEDKDDKEKQKGDGEEPSTDKNTKNDEGKEE